MKTIDKIIQSSTAPKRKDVVWFDTTTGELKMFGASGWDTVSGGDEELEATILADAITQEVSLSLSEEDPVGVRFAAVKIGLVVGGQEQILQTMYAVAYITDNSIATTSPYDRIGSFYMGNAYVGFYRRKNTLTWEIDGTFSGMLKQLAVLDDSKASPNATYSSNKIESLINSSVGVKFENNPSSSTYTYINPFTNTDNVYLGQYYVDRELPYIYDIVPIGKINTVMFYRSNPESSDLNSAPMTLECLYIDGLYHIYLYFRNGVDEHIYHGDTISRSDKLDTIQFAKIYPDNQEQLES